MRGLALAFTLSIPLWAGIIVVAVRVTDAARRGALPVLSLGREPVEASR